MYELPHDSPNNLRPGILQSYEMLRKPPNVIELLSSA